MSDSSDKEEKHGERYSYTTEVITFILKSANCPTKFRPFFDALIGIANGRSEFSASDAEVSGMTGHTKDWATDKRKELEKWQEENGITFLKYISGKREKDKFISTSYKFFLSKYAEQVEAEARKNEIDWKGNRDSAIYMAALKLVDELRRQSAITPKQKSSTKGYLPPDRLTQQLKTVRTNLKKAEKLLEKYDFKPTLDDKEIIEGIEKIIASIKQRGFADILDTIIFGSRVED